MTGKFILEAILQLYIHFRFAFPAVHVLQRHVLQMVYGGPAGQERNHAASQKPAFLEGLELDPDVNA
jgi:hypothetical protein